MTRAEAEANADRFNREHPDRGRHRWLARERDGQWDVARVTVPGGVRVDPLKQGVVAKPRPPEAPDPRSAFVRNVGGPYAT